MSGPPVQFFLPDFFHLLHENTEGMLKGFDSKLEKTEDPLSDSHSLQNSGKTLHLNSRLKPKPRFNNDKSDRLLCLVKSCHIIEDKRKKLSKYRTYVYRESCVAPIHTHLNSIVLEDHAEPCSKTVTGMRPPEIPGLLRSVIVKLLFLEKQQLFMLSTYYMARSLTAPGAHQFS